MKIVISPFSKKLRNNKENPKNYPYWPELIDLLKPVGEIYQVGTKDEPKLTENFVTLPIPELREFIKDMDLFFSVDNFFPHFAHHYGKHGVVLWGPSNPELFGYEENMNLFRDPKYFRQDQFGIWESCPANPEAFVKPSVILEAINNL